MFRLPIPTPGNLAVVRSFIPESTILRANIAAGTAYEPRLSGIVKDIEYPPVIRGLSMCIAEALDFPAHDTQSPFFKIDIVHADR